MTLKSLHHPVLPILRTPKKWITDRLSYLFKERKKPIFDNSRDSNDDKKKMFKAELLISSLND